MEKNSLNKKDKHILYFLNLSGALAPALMTYTPTLYKNTCNAFGDIAPPLRALRV
jgi:hypothetical protein